ncbi:Sec-independent protein translocase family protein [Candidatus Deianiraea vastatrix]|uniref:Sec-independent protein translocase protein TatB n=1 Tax=Candidatus Deianiraea vastatrix TaxID=2163644 RepID=A0A5B8XFQ5_9RICK|nr:hypothetical protein [Candidatus Deianiraea vastatrix]QED23776.1 Sec-independent protein translocase protein TatB [Candidatus Deianiraea vastatrix]
MIGISFGEIAVVAIIALVFLRPKDLQENVAKIMTTITKIRDKTDDFKKQAVDLIMQQEHDENYLQKMYSDIVLAAPLIKDFDERVNIDISRNNEIVNNDVASDNFDIQDIESRNEDRDEFEEFFLKMQDEDDFKTEKSSKTLSDEPISLNQNMQLNNNKEENLDLFLDFVSFPTKDDKPQKEEANNSRLSQEMLNFEDIDYEVLKEKLKK